MNDTPVPHEDRILVRATVHLPGGPDEPSLRPGAIVLVDPTMPYIQDCLRTQTLVPLPADQQPGELPSSR